MALDFTDFYIKDKYNPMYKEDVIIQDDIISIIVQKYEMIIFTTKGEVMGDPFFGSDLETILHDTMASSEYVESTLNEQITTYIPEIANIPYTLTASFFEDPERFQTYLEILFEIKDYEVYAIVA
jgi:hypothetical protein